jgi:peptidyl-prolyl cis-trans isomerase-like 2
VALKTSGNVFSYEAVQQFNIKLKSWRDLLSDKPFTRADIIHIQVQPHNMCDPLDMCIMLRWEWMTL